MIHLQRKCLSASPPTGPRIRRPQLEVLEDRCVPAELLATSFTLASLSVRAGETVQATYTLVNADSAPAGEFDVQVRLSPDVPLRAGSVSDGLVLDTIRLRGLAGGSLSTGVVTITLPAELGSQAFLSLVIDPDNRVAEVDETNNTAITALPLAQAVEHEPNDAQTHATPIALGQDVHGEIAAAGDVDYYVYEVREGGYLSADVLPRAGAGLDARLELYSVDSLLLLQELRLGGGGLIVASDDRSVSDNRPLVQLYLLPGRYYLAVSATEGEGEYVLRTDFIPSKSNPHDPLRDLGNWLPVGRDVRALIAADFNRDGLLDLATANHGGQSVSVLLGADGGSFQDQVVFSVPTAPANLAAFDFNGDDRLDLQVLDGDTGRVSVLLGLGDGGFLLLVDPRSGAAITFDQDDPAVSRFEPPTTVLTGDFNRDGNSDFVGVPTDPRAPADVLGLLSGSPVDVRTDTDLRQSPFIGVLKTLGFPEVLTQVDGEPHSVMLDRAPAIPVRATPLVAELTGDGVLDVLVLNRQGDILIRPGIEGRPGVFASPFTVNADPALPRAREVVILGEGRGSRIAAVDSESATLSIYDIAFDSDGVGRWRRSDVLPTGFLPFRLTAGDVNGDGRLDLVVGNVFLGTVQLYEQTDRGEFVIRPQMKAGIALSDLRLEDANGDGWLDILVSDVSHGSIGVMLNQTRVIGAAAKFDAEVRYHASQPFTGREAGEYGVVEVASNVANYLVQQQPGFTESLLRKAGLSDQGVIDQIAQAFKDLEPFPRQYILYSTHETRGVITGDFTGDGIPDIVALNSGTATFSLLRGKGPTGGYVDPVTFRTTGRPVVMAAGRLNDDDWLDLVIVDDVNETASIFLNNGRGGFTEMYMGQRLKVGTAPSGVSLSDVTQPGGGGPDGRLDLLVGNDAGDLLVLAGAGDGTFTSANRFPRRSPFGLTDLNGDGVPDVVLASAADHQLVTQVRRSGSSQFRPGSFQRLPGDDGLLGPEAVALADLDGRFGDDLIVANSGRNNVLVYLRQSDGSFAPAQTFSVGTNPVGLSVADVNGDGKPDLLVANQGSSDISVLLGDWSEGWTFIAGARQRAGVSGPTQVSVRDLTGDRVPDIVVTAGSTGQVAVLPGIGRGEGGVGSGFFLDSQPQIVNLGVAVAETALGRGAQGVALTATGDLLGFNLSTGRVQSVFHAGATAGFSSFALLPGGSQVVAAGPGGVVSLLDSDGLTFREVVRVVVPGLDEPSALQVLAQGRDLFEVYLSDAGELQPVVLTLDLRSGLVAVDRDQTGTPLALAVTLVTGTPTEPASVPDRTTANAEVAVYRPLLEGSLDLIDVGGADEEMDEEGTVEPPGEQILQQIQEQEQTSGVVESEPPNLNDFISGVDEALLRLGWQGEGDVVRSLRDRFSGDPGPVARSLRDRFSGDPGPVRAGSELNLPAEEIEEVPVEETDLQEPDAAEVEEPEAWRVRALDVLLAGGLVLCGLGAGMRTRRAIRRSGFLA